ncbi:MAG: type IV pilus biogenesis/stability protein PilW [Gammaproteobacteria bacterium]|nr:type IV pilus biogenesis/stability protein PilW [Gammaproteobacteria bacterium]
MKKLLLLLLLIFALPACNQTGNSTIRPKTTTNEATISNIHLGVEYMRRGEFEQALTKLERAREADPGYYGVYNVLGVLYQRLGDPKQAERYFKKAIRLNANDSATLNNYGQFLCQTDRPDEAEQTFLRAADNPLYETPEIAITNAGLCASLNGQPNTAERYFRQALSLNPTIPIALIRMSQLSYEHAKYLSARAYLQRYLAITKHNAKTLWLGIRIEQNLGDDNAISSYSLLLRNNFPDSDEASMLQEAGIH